MLLKHWLAAFRSCSPQGYGLVFGDEPLASSLEDSIVCGRDLAGCGVRLDVAHIATSVVCDNDKRRPGYDCCGGSGRESGKSEQGMAEDIGGTIREHFASNV